MFDWLPLEIPELLKNIPNTWVMIFIGTLVAIVFLLLLYKKFRVTKQHFVIKESPVKRNQFTDHIYVTLQWLAMAIRTRFSRRHQNYNQHIIYEHRFLNRRSGHPKDFLSWQFDQVFIELQILKFDNFQRISDQPEGQSHFIWDILRLSKFNNTTQLLAIIGAPGSGKTTLLRHLVLTYANNKQRQYQLLPRVPILLFLPQHVQRIANDEFTTIKQLPTLAELVHEDFHVEENDAHLNLPPSWFARQLKKGHCLVLLDGLSEVGDLKQRKTFSTWIEKQVQNYPRCQFIITARPQGYLTSPIKKALILEIQPFHAEQTQQFIEKWFLSHQITSSAKKREQEVLAEIKPKIQELWQNLQNQPNLNALAVNPLLLTMMMRLYHLEGQLPTQRVELYANISNILIDNLTVTDEEDNELTFSQKQKVLQNVAADMMQRKLSHITTEEALSILNTSLEQIGLFNVNAQSFFNGWQANRGFLLESKKGRWHFAHLTFQEYFAAVHFLEQQKPLDKPFYINESWWYEVLWFYGMQGHCQSILQTCLSGDNVSTLMLASSILEESPQLDEGVREQVITSIMSHLESGDAKKRHLAAEIKLIQRFKNLYRIDEQREVDLEYITCAEYQLFLDELRAKDHYYQPDHWTEYTFPSGSALKPICGIRAEDAEAFCQWLTKRQNDHYYYRLPQPHEAKDFPAVTNTHELATWCKTEQDIYGLMGLTKEDEIIIHAKLQNLSDLPLSPGYAIAKTSALSRIIEQTEFLDDAISHAIGKTFVKRNFAMVYEPFHFNPLLLERAIVRDIKHVSIEQLQMASQPALVKQIETQQRLNALLSYLLACGAATNSLEQRQAWRKYVAHLAKISWLGYNELEKHNTASWLQQKHNYTQEKKFMLNLHWWLEIALARENGQLPAWESLRVVRVRRNQ
jgi:ABC-type dipeptide/oligopeptide/nickel transport system ATPase subunit